MSTGETSHSEPHLHRTNSLVGFFGTRALKPVMQLSEFKMASGITLPTAPRHLQQQASTLCTALFIPFPATSFISLSTSLRHMPHGKKCLTPVMNLFTKGFLN